MTLLLVLQFFSKAPFAPQLAITAVFTVVTVLFIANMFKDYFEALDAGTLAAVSALGEDYLAGGVEYYEKLEERGKAMREAMQYGDAYFEESGDLIPFRFMIRRPTYRERIDALKQELDKKRNGGDKR